MKNRIIFFLLLGALAGAPVYPVQAQNKTFSLSEAVAFAQEHNREIRVQALEAQKADLATSEARSYLLPNLTATGTYSRYFSRPVIFMPGAFTGNPEEPVHDVAVGGKNAFNGVLSLNQPLWLQTAHHRIKVASLSARMVNEKSSQLKNEVIWQIQVSYLSALFLQEQLELQYQSLERNKRALADSKSLLKQGQALRSDTLRQHVAIQNLLPAISALQNKIRIAKSELKIRMGLEGPAALVLSDSLSAQILSSPESLPLEQAYATAWDNRPDVKQQLLAVQLSKKQLNLVRAEKSPSVWGVGQLQAQAQADNVRLGQYRWPATSFIGAQIVVPIFSGFKTDLRVKQTQADNQQQAIRLLQLQEQVKTDLDSRLSSLEEARQRWHTGKSTVESARISYQLTTDRYQQGLASRLELTDAELSYSQAKLNLIQAAFDFKLAQVHLEHSLGRFQ